MTKIVAPDLLIQLKSALETPDPSRVMRQCGVLPKDRPHLYFVDKETFASSGLHMADGLNEVSHIYPSCLDYSSTHGKPSVAVLRDWFKH